LEDLNERREVVIREERISVIKVGISGAFGAAAIITKVVVGAASMGPGAKHFVDRAKYLVNDKAGEGRGERVSLGETILLDEMVKGAIRAVEEAVIWLLVHEIEIVDKGLETWFRLQGGEGSFARHLVPTIC
jgi:ribosome-associated protein YbcJ (S4-like RNA binding protein)